MDTVIESGSGTPLPIEDSYDISAAGAQGNNQADERDMTT